jgi:type IV pilus assembly protein PilA
MRCGADISAAPVAFRPQDSYAAQAAPQQPYYAPAPAKSSNSTVIIILVAVGAVVLVPVVLIVAAIAIPNLMRARIAANESSAVAAVRTINTAATSYQAQFNHYPEGLASMGPPVAGVSPEYGAGLIDNTLASGKKTGYVFSYQGLDTKHSGTLDDYQVTACPERRSTTGVRCFFSDSTGVIRYSVTGTADKDSDPL